MGERTTPGPVCGCGEQAREAVCVHTSKVYDACRSKECISDLRVYLTRQSQELLDRSNSVKPRRAELLWVKLDVAPVDFNRGFFSVDARFFYRVFAEVNAGCGRMTDICGLAVFDKRAILFGCEGNVRTFTSKSRMDGMTARTIEQSNMPRAVVETLDPIILSAKIVEPHCRCECHCCDDDIPEYLGCMFDEELILSGDVKKLFVTLGQFSIIRLERDVQILVPAFDACMPTKECRCGTCEPEDPCRLFDQIEFPEEEFRPVCREPKKKEDGCRHGDPPKQDCRKCGSR